MLYLFVRGMAGADTPRIDGVPCGVFSWRPSPELVVECSDLLGAGAAVSPTRNLGESLLATLPPGVLADFHAAGVLGLGDVHTARGLGRIVGETDETVLLAAALTVRALRLGSVCLELERQRDDVFDSGEEAVDASDLTWRIRTLDRRRAPGAG